MKEVVTKQPQQKVSQQQIIPAHIHIRIHTDGQNHKVMGVSTVCEEVHRFFNDVKPGIKLSDAREKVGFPRQESNNVSESRSDESQSECVFVFMSSSIMKKQRQGTKVKTRRGQAC